MSYLDISPATIEQAIDLGPRLRQADVQEVKAACGMDAADALFEAVKNAKRSDAWCKDGKVIAISGVTDSGVDNATGVVWMLTSDEMEQSPKNFMIDTRGYVQDLLKTYAILFNFVDNRNIKAQRWLKWLGFQLGDPQPFGVDQLPFRPFWISATGELRCPSPGHDEINRVEVHHV